MEGVGTAKPFARSKRMRSRKPDLDRQFTKTATVGLTDAVVKGEALAASFKNAGEEAHKLNAAALDMGGKDRLTAAMEQAQAQIRLADMQYQQTVEKYNASAKAWQMTESQKTAATLDALQQRYNAELAQIDAQNDLEGLSVAPAPEDHRSRAAA